MSNSDLPTENTGNKHLHRQFLAAKLTGYGPIALRRVGDYAVVEIERDGKWYGIIKEPIDSQFSHIVEPLGIEAALTEAGAMGIKHTYADENLGIKEVQP